MKKKVKIRRRNFKKKTSIKVYIGSVILVLLIATIAAWLFYEIIGQKAADNWVEAKSVAANGGQINLPKDDAPHPESNSESWVYQGRVISDSGKRYSFYYTTMVTSDSKSQAISFASVDDFQTAQHYVDQFRNEINPGFGVDDHFYFSTTDRLMQGGDGIDHLKIKAKDFTFDLTLKGSAYPIFHGKNGIISLDKDYTSYYYSRPRLKVTGSVSIGHKAESVTGVAWFDHQWGDFSSKSLGLDWFGLQLADGSDVMIYQVRDQSNNPAYANASITRDGVTEIIANKDFVLKPLEQWVSAKTGASFPIAWQFLVPEKHVDITVRSLIKNSEFDGRVLVGATFWSGAIGVEGSHPGQGFMHLSALRK